MGGSSGGTPAITTEEQAPPRIASGPVPVQDYAAFSPGQQGLLAEQMQQGFGGSLLDHQNAMGFYQDMQVPNITRPDQIAAYLAQLQGSASAAGPGQGNTAGPVGNPFSGGYGMVNGGAVDPNDSTKAMSGWSGGYNR